MEATFSLLRLAGMSPAQLDAATAAAPDLFAEGPGALDAAEVAPRLAQLGYECGRATGERGASSDGGNAAGGSGGPLWPASRGSLPDFLARQPRALTRRFAAVHASPHFVALSKPAGVRLDTPRGWGEAEGGPPRYVARYAGDTSVEDWLVAHRRDWPPPPLPPCAPALSTLPRGVLLAGNAALRGDTAASASDGPETSYRSGRRQDAVPRGGAGGGNGKGRGRGAAADDACVKFRFVHQLDTATSGLLLTARTSSAAAAASAAFLHRTAAKSYLALVFGHPLGDVFEAGFAVGPDLSDATGFRMRADVDGSLSGGSRGGGGGGLLLAPRRRSREGFKVSSIGRSQRANTQSHLSSRLFRLSIPVA